MHLEFQRANAVRDAFDVIAQAMGEIIHRVDAPFAAGVMMLGVADAVEQRIAHPDVRRGHVNLRAQRTFAVGKLAGLHAPEQIEIFLHAAVAVGRFLGLAAVFVGFVRRQIADVGLALFDQLLRVIVNLVEIIGGVKRLDDFRFRISDFRFGDRREIKIPVAVRRDGFGRFAFRLQAELVVGPAADEPVHVLDDGIHVFDVFLGRVGVVHAQIANAAELARDAEIQADAFGVADVEVAVRLRRKARVDLRIFLFRNVLGTMSRMKSVGAAAALFSRLINRGEDNKKVAIVQTKCGSAQQRTQIRCITNPRPN